MKGNSLPTQYEQELYHTDIPFSQYPRPQLRRDSYLCLNGIWDFKVTSPKGVTYDGTILVPFVPESRISGVMKKIRPDDRMIYERSFVLEQSFIKDKVLLHFGGCDQTARVFINGAFVGAHQDGYLPFSFDITPYVVVGVNTITVEATDPLDKSLPYGKQTRKPGGMWYTNISGIWQTVWLESVPADSVEAIRITPDLTGVTIRVITTGQTKRLCFEGHTYEFTGDSFRLEVENPVLWTPEHPHLYEFTLSVGEDTVSSYFALRTISVEKRNGIPLLCLNGQPYYFHGLLDQGYYSDGIFLPATPRGFRDDIIRMKQCGFNMLRKHIKLEPELFYYYCDQLGMVVFQDFVNNGSYRFLRDTALPTIGWKKGMPKTASRRQREGFETNGKQLIQLLFNHPSVVYYTIFNEGWGQHAPNHYYHLCKEMDPTRIYDTTSGWFKSKETDVESDHVYFKPIKAKGIKKKPWVLSEFGGYSCKISGHCYRENKNYGYRFFTSREEWEQELLNLYEAQILPAIDKGLCATVLTQVSDVEEETNGLLTYDRQMLKVHPMRFKSMADTLQKRFKETWI